MEKIYSEWFPSNSYEHGDAPSLEVYKSPDPTSPVAKTEIWVPVK
nr:GyrI-like domain-containing protein [Paenibacillus cisolokensis]